MAHDLDGFSEEPIEFSVEHQGRTMQFFVEPTSIKEFSGAFRRSSQDMDANMKRTFVKLLLDEDQKPVTAEWVDKLLSKKNLVPLALKINAALNSALGLDDLAAKKG
jgi:hypothetical protein